MGWVPRGSVSKTEGGYAIVVNGRTRIRVVFGRIQDSSLTNNAEVVVLPTTEFFDDECIRDEHSALGAFAAAYFKDPCALLPLARQELGEPQQDRTYGIGQCAYLRDPLGTRHRILLVSVTTMDGGRTRAQVEYIYRAVASVRAMMARHRIASCVLPVLGAGHGNLPHQVALFHLVAALAHAVSDAGGGPLVTEATIVVYTASKGSDPEIPPRVVKRVLRTVSELLAAA